MTKSGTKIALLGYFWAKISKSYSHIWNQSLWFSAIVKFCEETKTPKFGTKNALFVFELESKKKKILSYLKSAPLNLPNCKILRKNKNA